MMFIVCNIYWIWKEFIMLVNVVLFIILFMVGDVIVMYNFCICLNMWVIWLIGSDYGKF